MCQKTHCGISSIVDIFHGMRPEVECAPGNGASLLRGTIHLLALRRAKLPYPCTNANEPHEIGQAARHGGHVAGRTVLVPAGRTKPRLFRQGL